MKKLLYIILLLPLWVNAQTNGTIQKTASSGTIRGSFGSLGLDTLVNVNAPTNGYVPVYNSTLKKSVWTNPSTFSPTISFGTFGSTPNAQGGSYSGGVITLQPADATNPGGVSTTTQTFTGDKTLTGSLTAPVIINSTIASTATNAITGNFINNSTGFATIKATNSGSGNLAEFANSGGVVATITNGGGINSATLGNGLVKSTSGLLSNATAGTDYLTPTGSGSGLSGVVLLAGNQSISDNKTFTGRLISSVNIEVAKVLEFTAQSNLVSHASGSAVIYANGSQGFTFDATSLTGRGGGILFPVHGGTPKTYTFPNTTGTIALTSDIPSYTNYWQKIGTSLSPVTANDIIDYTYSGSSNAFAIVNSGSGIGSQITSSSTGTSYNANISSTANGYSVSMAGTGFGFQASGGNSSGIGFYSNNSSSYTGVPFRYRKNGVNLWEIDNTGALTGTSATFSGAVSATGSISSTPQGTLYGTASGSITSAQLATSLTDETGTGSAVFSAGPTFTTPNIGVATATSIGSNGSTALPFLINGAEKGMFSASGFLKASNDGTYVGSTATYHELRTSESSNAVTITNSHASDPYGVSVAFTGATINNATNYLFSGADNGNVRFQVMANGGIHNYSANNVNLSDERAKENITKVGSYWDIIKAIEFDNYNYKDQTDSRTLLGVMAQQVESVNPAWVSNSGGFGKASDGTNLKSVYEQQLQYGVNIVVQEIMKKVEVLEAEIKILKSK